MPQKEAKPNYVSRTTTVSVSLAFYCSASEMFVSCDIAGNYKEDDPGFS